MISEHITAGRFIDFIVDVAKSEPEKAAQMLLWDKHIRAEARDIWEINFELTSKRWPILGELLARADSISAAVEIESVLGNA